MGESLGTVCPILCFSCGIFTTLLRNIFCRSYLKAVSEDPQSIDVELARDQCSATFVCTDISSILRQILSMATIII